MSELDSLERARDHFELFGLPRAFEVDESALQSKYLQLTRLTHPDFAGADVEAQMRAMELSARVNEAWRVLSDPEERANYLLELLGGPSREEDKTLPEGFLETVMMLREELADAQAEKDAETLAGLGRQAQAERAKRLGAIAVLFIQLDRPSASLAEIGKSLRVELNALRYVQRVLAQVS